MGAVINCQPLCPSALSSLPARLHVKLGLITCNLFEPKPVAVCCSYLAAYQSCSRWHHRWRWWWEWWWTWTS